MFAFLTASAPLSTVRDQHFLCDQHHGYPKDFDCVDDESCSWCWLCQWHFRESGNNEPSVSLALFRSSFAKHYSARYFGLPELRRLYQFKDSGLRWRSI